MGHTPIVRCRHARVVSYKSDAAITRILRLEGQLAAAPTTGFLHRQLAAAISTEADHYRKALDAEQAAEQFDPKPSV